MSDSPQQTLPNDLCAAGWVLNTLDGLHRAHHPERDEHTLPSTRINEVIERAYQLQGMHDDLHPTAQEEAVPTKFMNTAPTLDEELRIQGWRIESVVTGGFNARHSNSDLDFGEEKLFDSTHAAVLAASERMNDWGAQLRGEQPQQHTQVEPPVKADELAATSVSPMTQNELSQPSNKLPLTRIRTDGGTQTRTTTDMLVVADYAEAMRGGAVFPPVIVFDDGQDVWLADGFHRVLAARKADLAEIAVDVRSGSRRDAVLFSVGANAQHGLPRTPADKRRAVETLLRDKEWHVYSDGHIARLTHVSQSFVSKVRREMETSGVIETTTVRKGHDGRVTDISRVGDVEEPNDDQPFLPTVAEALAASHPADDVLDLPPATQAETESASQLASSPIDPEFKTVDDLVAALKAQPEGLHVSTLADAGFTPGLLQHAVKERRIERRDGERYKYIWTAVDVATAVDVGGPLTLLALEELGCNRYAITVAEQDNLIRSTDAGYVIADNSKPASNQPTSALFPADTPTNDLIPATATVEPEPARPAIEELLDGRGMVISLVWIKGVPGKVSISVNAGDSPETADRAFLDAAEVRPLPEALMGMIAAQIERAPKAAAPSAATAVTPKVSPVTKAAAAKKPASAKTTTKAPAKKATKAAAKLSSKTSTKKTSATATK